MGINDHMTIDIGYDTDGYGADKWMKKMSVSIC